MEPLKSSLYLAKVNINDFLENLSAVVVKVIISEKYFFNFQ